MIDCRIVTAADATDDLIRGVLEVQRRLAWRPGMTPEDIARGFLGTTWSAGELRALLHEGGYLTIAVDDGAGALLGYSMMAAIRHLPGGAFEPEPDSPVRSREEFSDAARFVYGYQIGVHPDRRAGGLVARAIDGATASENARRGVNAIMCFLETPVRNERSAAFVAATGLRRIGTIHDPRGPALIPGPATWACVTRLP